MNAPANRRAAEARQDMMTYKAEIAAHVAQQAAMPLLDPLWRCHVHVECDEHYRLIWLSIDVTVDDWLNIFEDVMQ